MKAADLIIEVIQAVGLPVSSLEKGAGITEYARHVPDYLVRCAQIGTGPDVRERIRSSFQCRLSAISDRCKEMFQQGSLGIHSSIITFGSPDHPFPRIAILLRSLCGHWVGLHGQMASRNILADFGAWPRTLGDLPLFDMHRIEHGC